MAEFHKLGSVKRKRVNDRLQLPQRRNGNRRATLVVMNACHHAYRPPLAEWGSYTHSGLQGPGNVRRNFVMKGFVDVNGKSYFGNHY